MSTNLIGHVLQYAGILIEACLVIYLLATPGGPACWGIPVPACLAGAGLGRGLAATRYGWTSPQYSLCLLDTDFLLVLSRLPFSVSLLPTCLPNQEKLWRFVRLLLRFSFRTCGRHFRRVLSSAITAGSPFPTSFEFSQDLYFTCLVLNTLLYLLLQQIGSIDDQLGLLVCGVGIQFAGPSATMALYHLTTGQRFSASLTFHMLPMCTLGMLLVWAYAVIHVSDRVN